MLVEVDDDFEGVVETFPLLLDLVIGAGEAAGLEVLDEEVLEEGLAEEDVLEAVLAEEEAFDVGLEALELFLAVCFAVEVLAGVASLLASAQKFRALFRRAFSVDMASRPSNQRVNLRAQFSNNAPSFSI